MAGQDASPASEAAVAEAGKTAGVVGRMARRMAEEQKKAGAERLDDVVRVINRVAGELDREMPATASYVREAASGMERFSSAIRERSVGDLLDGLGGFARRQPMAFFGASVLAGLALSRFLKSSAQEGEAGRPS